MNIWLIFLIFAIGIIVGSTITRIITYIASIGQLMVNTSDGETYCFMKLSKSPLKLKHGKYITLKVNTDNFNTQE